jgi:hypothetical protein
MKPETRKIILTIACNALIITGNAVYWTLPYSALGTIFGLIFGGALLGYIVGDWATMKLERGDFEK